MLRAVRRARRQRQHGGHIGRRYRSVKPPATQCNERNALYESAAKKLNKANPNQPVTTERGRTRSEPILLDTLPRMMIAIPEDLHRLLLTRLHLYGILVMRINNWD